MRISRWPAPGVVRRVTAEIDIYRSAGAMIAQHGEEALLEAGMRADTLLEKGDLVGYRAWLRILTAIRELQKATPAESDALH